LILEKVEEERTPRNQKLRIQEELKQEIEADFGDDASVN